MGKFVLFAVLFAALVAVSAAHGVSEQSFTDTRCWREVQAKPLQACRQILYQKLTGAPHEGALSTPLFQTLWDAREQCCRQIQSVSRECRCSAIRGMVRDYEQTMGPPGQGHCGGETAEHHQQGGGYYGEEGRDQQGQQTGQWYYGGGTVVSQQQKQGMGYYGERPQQQQQGGGYYSQQHQQQHHGEGFYGETSRHQQGQKSYREAQQKQQQIGRVKLTKVRQYLAGLPTVCQIEPMECSVFSADQY